jgi:hypothetical protein
MRKIALAALTLAFAFALAPAQAEAQNCWINGNTADRPSPLDSAVVMMGDDVVKVCYGAPSARGRTMVGEGGVHPFGEPWRTGANEATSIHLPFAATVAGVEVEAGSYSLYTVPGADSWTIHVNSVADRWGTQMNMANDVGTGDAPASANEHVETLAMTFENASADAATLVLRWEGYRVEIPVARRN